ncbi:MAG: hypothetical protein WBB84_04990, partial [Candidatus Omnitrophota bacterium]
EEWMNFGAFLLSRALYTSRTDNSLGLNSAPEMAGKVVKMSAKKDSLNYDSLSSFAPMPGLRFMELTRYAGARSYLLAEFATKCVEKLKLKGIINFLNKYFS